MSRQNRDESRNLGDNKHSKSQPGKPKTKKAAKTKMKAKAKGEEGVRTDEFEFFYSKNSPFSQHYPCKFEIEGIQFNCAEQYMMYQKAVVFEDKTYADLIMKTDKPVEQKKYGRKVRNFQKDVWGRESKLVVERANLAKFGQNPDIKAILLKTHPRELVEASPRDRVWGIGLGANNPKARDKKTWLGRNQLGMILTRVRDKLRGDIRTTSEGSSSSSDGIGKSSNDKDTFFTKDSKDKGVSSKYGKDTVLIKDSKDRRVSGEKRKYENDGKDVHGSKKQKMSDDRNKTKDDEDDFVWLEKTKENIGKKSDKGEQLHIEGRDRNTSTDAGCDEMKRKEKSEKRREKRRKSKERRLEKKSKEREEKRKEDTRLEQLKDERSEGKRKEARGPEVMKEGERKGERNEARVSEQMKEERKKHERQEKK